MNTPKYQMLVSPGGIFPAGKYVVERQNAGELLAQVPQVEIEPIPAGYRPLRGHPIRNGAHLLFVRPGGFGDLLFCTPTFREIKRTHPDCVITVACLANYKPILEHNPDVDRIIPYPVPMEEWLGTHHHVWMERLLEEGVDNVRETWFETGVQLVAKAAGVTLTEFRTRYEMTDEERAVAAEKYPRREGQLRIGIQVQASAVNRTYPQDHLENVASRLINKGCEVFLFGAPGKLAAAPPLVNLSGLSFRESCAVLSTCDCVIAPDSALCHVAGALNRPVLALYGPFSSEVRTRHQPTVFAINGKADCAPCNHHAYTGKNPWPEGCPGWKTGRCQALANIDPRRVAEMALKLAETKFVTE